MLECSMQKSSSEFVEKKYLNQCLEKKGLAEFVAMKGL